MKSASAQASDKSHVLDALGKTASEIRKKLGESLGTVHQFDVPIQVTTSSLEALKNYSAGVTVLREKGAVPSIPFLKRAIELDPNFPMAYAALSNVYNNLNQPSLALEYATKAYQLRDRVSEREKLSISAYYFRATGEVEKESQTYELWTANYPRDWPHANLGVNYLQIGQYEKAPAEFQETVRVELTYWSFTPESCALILERGGARSGGSCRWSNSWERPEVCAERLYRILAKDRWSSPGDARWFFEDKEQPWPAVACNEDTRRAVRETTERLLRITREPQLADRI